MAILILEYSTLLLAHDFQHHHALQQAYTKYLASHTSVKVNQWLTASPEASTEQVIHFICEAHLCVFFFFLHWYMYQLLLHQPQNEEAIVGGG